VPCYSRGECLLSSSIEFRALATPKECHQLCLDMPNCEYFTHYGSQSQDFGCFAWANCMDVGQDCADCVSGSADCPLIEEVITPSYSTFLLIMP